MLFLVIPGLLLLLRDSGSLRAAGWLGFWFGFAHHVIGLFWITDAILIEAARYWWLVPFAVPGVAAVLALFIAAPCVTACLVPAGWGRVLVFAGAWTLADLARQFVATGFPWNPWGSVWAVPGPVGTVFLQLVAWIGAPGLTLVTVLLAATPVLGRRGMAAGAAGLALLAGFGLLRLREADAAGAPGVEIVLVQGNVAEGQKLDRDLAVGIFRHYLDLTHAGVQAAMAAAPPGRAPAIVVVWPESASPFLLQADAGARHAVAQAALPAAAALVGSLRFAAGSPDQPRNSLIALGPDGQVSAVYDKWHLVPFGEYQPSWALLPIQVVPGGGFTAGPGPATLHLPGLPPVGPLICYEAIFPGEVTARADRPAWLVNITNDAWFGELAGPRQHLAFVRMRAVEEGLPLMRAANTGISAGFDAFGRELGRLGMDRAGVLDLALPGPLPPTPFARWGLLIPFLLALGAVGSGFLGRRVSSPIMWTS